MRAAAAQADESEGAESTTENDKVGVKEQDWSPLFGGKCQVIPFKTLFKMPIQNRWDHNLFASTIL